MGNSKIARISGKPIKRVTNEDDGGGGLEITILVEDMASKKVARELEKGKYYFIDFKENLFAQNGRTQNQNRLFWKIVNKIAEKKQIKNQNDIYLAILEKAGLAKYEYVSMLKGHEGILKDQFNIVIFANEFLFNGNVFNCYKVYYGARKLGKEDFTTLLNTAIEVAQKCGIDLNMEDEEEGAK